MTKQLSILALSLMTLSISNFVNASYDESTFNSQCAVLKNGKPVQQTRCKIHLTTGGGTYFYSEYFEFKIPSYGDFTYNISSRSDDENDGETEESLNNKDAVSSFRHLKTFKKLTKQEETKYYANKLNAYVCAYQKNKPTLEICFVAR